MAFDILCGQAGVHSTSKRPHGSHAGMLVNTVLHSYLEPDPDTPLHADQCYGTVQGTISVTVVIASLVSGPPRNTEK